MGLAFERNTIYMKSKDMLKRNDGDGTEEKLLTDAESEILNLNFIDIFHYSFNYIAILTGKFITLLCFDGNILCTPFHYYRSLF